MDTTTEFPVPLSPDQLYLGDNGRCFCGSLRCAGASAFFAGYTTAGQPVHVLTPGELRALERDLGRPMKCESCGSEARSCS